MKVSIICVSDRPTRLPLLYWSLVAQTHKDWELIVLDQQGQYVDTVLVNIWPTIKSDNRVVGAKVINYGDWGQTAKEAMGKATDAGDCLMFPADDAYYVPTALATMVSHIERGDDLVVCGWLYDVLGYAPMPPRIAKGYVDVGGFMVRTSTFREVGWRDKSQTGDYTLIRDIADKVGPGRVTYEPRILYVKN